MADEWIYWTIFAAYLVFLAVAGIRAKGKTHTFEDFMVAGRNIGPLLLGVSFGVTYFSAVMIIGGGQFSWIWGLGAVWIAVIDCLVGVFAAFFFFGKRTMLMSEELETLTLSELLGKRYQSDSVQMYTATVTLIFETVYLVSIYMGLSILLSYAMPDVDLDTAYLIAVILCGAITVVYLNIGGAHGAITTDVVEAILMLGGVALIMGFGLEAVGGLEGLVDGLTEIGTENGDPDMYVTFPGAGGFGIIGYILVTAFGVWGMPQMISRYFTVNKKKDIKGGLIIAILWSLVVALLAWWNGAIGRVYYYMNPDLTSPTPAAVIPALMHDLLPPILAALFMAAITAASLTTGEKVIMVASSCFSRDVYQLKSGCSDEKAMMLTQIMNTVVVVVGVILAIQKPDAVLALCMFAWSALASVVLIPYVFGLFWKKGTKAAALLSGMIALFFALAWKVTMRGGIEMFADLLAKDETRNASFFDFDGKPVPLRAIHEFIVSQVVGLIAFPIVSLLTQPQIDKEYVDTLFEVITGEKPIGSLIKKEAKPAVVVEKTA